MRRTRNDVDHGHFQHRSRLTVDEHARFCYPQHCA
jgi:hypothetical protein